MKAKYKIDINSGICGSCYALFRRSFWVFWKRIDTSCNIEELEEKLKEVRKLPKYFE